MSKTVIGVTGLPGSGKTACRKIACRLGYSVIVMGDVIRDEAKRRKLSPTPENLSVLMFKLREEANPAVVAKRCLLKMNNIKGSVVVVEGIRSLHEVEEFKNASQNFFLVAIHASPQTRFRRLFRRNRSDDPKNWKEFVERDRRELMLGSGSVIACAEYMIVNERTLSQLQKKVYRLFSKIFQPKQEGV